MLSHSCYLVPCAHCSLFRGSFPLLSPKWAFVSLRQCTSTVCFATRNIVRYDEGVHPVFAGRTTGVCCPNAMQKQDGHPYDEGNLTSAYASYYTKYSNILFIGK